MLEKFTTSRVLVHALDHKHRTDLVDMRSISQHNDNYIYIQTVIDVCLNMYRQLKSNVKRMIVLLMPLEKA